MCVPGERERTRKSGENDGRDERDEREIVMMRKM